MRRRSKISAVSLWIIIVAGVMLLIINRWPQGQWLKTDFYSLLPSGSDNTWLVRASALAASAYESQLLLMVEGNDGAEVSQFLEAAGDRLLREGYVYSRLEESETKKWRILSERLYPHRWNLLYVGDRESLQKNPVAHLEQFRRQLYSPLGIALIGKLQSDPAGFYRNYLEAAMPSEATASRAAANGDKAVEFAAYLVSPQQQGFGGTNDLYATYLSLRAEAEEAGLKLHATGVPLYSAFGVHSAASEISTIGTASLVLSMLLLIVVLRSTAAIFLTIFCAAIGVAGGLLITVSILQQIHIITLVFGSTIIGVADDYGFHYLSHSLAPDWTRKDALKKVWRGLSLAALSSVVAFLGLTLLPFPGIRQIGIFMAGGILCSFATVCILFPVMYRGAGTGARLPRFFVRQQFTIRTVIPTLLLLCAVVIPGLMMLQSQDDVREFYAVSNMLKDDQVAISSTLSVTPNSRYLLVRGHGIEDLLETEERLMNAADELVERGQAIGLSGVTRLIPSTATQQQNFSLMRRLVESGYLGTYLNALDMDSSFQMDLLASVPKEFRAMGLDVLKDIAMPLGTGGFLGCEGGECASWVRVSGSSSSQALAELIGNDPSVILVDPIADINGLLAHYRVGISKLLIAGGVATAMHLMVILGWRLALQILLIPTVSCLGSLALIGYIHSSYSIVNLLALLLLIGVSLDTAIFRVSTDSVDQPATSLAITLSALTTILAFGILAFSQTPVISAFGQSIVFGLIVTYCLSWVRFDLKV